MMMPTQRRVGRRNWTTRLCLAGHLTLLLCCEPGRLVAVEGASACLMHAEDCTQEGDCCSGSCVDNACGSLLGCRLAGESCSTAAALTSECCSGYCDNTFQCAALTTGEFCRVVGERCQGNNDCCSAACSSSTALGGPKRCQPIDGCNPIGELCTSEAECCSDYCTADADANGVRRCQLAGNAAACGAPGSPCQIDAPESCCSNRCVTDEVTGQARCQPGSADSLKPGELCGTKGIPCSGAGASGDNGCLETKEGIARCPNTQPGREYETDPCASASACCTPSNQACDWFCLPQSGGQTWCANSCVTEGGACRAAADCCSALARPTTCHNGECRLTGVTCQQLGQPCATAEECCSGSCEAIAGPFEGTFCVVPTI